MRCLTPFSVANPLYPHSSSRVNIPVPCGKCPSCLQKRAHDWTFRLLQEQKVSHYSHFITLTYDTDHVPISHNGFMSLHKTDLQKFWKRLRKMQETNYKIKYYACGEYGTRFSRPHYHAVVFNVDDPLNFQRAWTLDGVSIGRTHYGEVNVKSTLYTVNYMNKPKVVPKHARDDRIREFSNMSKNLGSSFLTPQMIRYFKDDLTRQYVLMPDGWKHSLPRYYKKKIFSEEELFKISVAADLRTDEWLDLDPVDLHYSIEAVFDCFKAAGKKRRLE